MSLLALGQKSVPKSAAQVVRFFTNDYGWLIAQKTDFHILVEFDVGFVSQNFDVYVSTSQLKEYLKVIKEPLFRYEDGVLSMNDLALTTVQTESPQVYQLNPTKVMKVNIDDKMLELIRKSARFTATSEERPICTYVAVDEHNVVATDTYVLYKGQHNAQVDRLMFIPGGVVPYLCAGEIQAEAVKSKTHYVFCGADRKVYWSVDDLIYFNYNKIITDKPLSEEFPAGKWYLEYVNKLAAQAKCIGAAHNPIRVKNVLCSDHAFSAKYVQLILKTIGKENFTVSYTENLSPIRFDTCNETMILTPVRPGDDPIPE